MRLTSLRIQNFRAFADETVHFHDYTCLVGPNGGGKSTVLTALNIFFRETTDARTDLLKREAEDFHHRNTRDPIVITVTCEGLNAAAQSELADYVHHGKLVVSAVAIWDEERQCTAVVQYGERRGMEDFKAFFRAEGEGAPVKDLKALYVVLRLKYETLPPPGTKQEMIAALRQFAAGAQ